MVVAGHQVRVRVASGHAVIEAGGRRRGCMAQQRTEAASALGGAKGHMVNAWNDGGWGLVQLYEHGVIQRVRGRGDARRLAAISCRWWLCDIYECDEQHEWV